MNFKNSNQIKTKFKPYDSIHHPTADELFLQYGYNYFPLNDIISLDWYKEIIKLENSGFCSCGSGKLMTDCHNKMNKNSVIATAWRKYQLIDDTVLKLQTENDVSFLCKKGCHACCDYYFYISDIEYFSMKYYLLTTNPDVFSRCKTKALKLYPLLKKNFPEEAKYLDSKDTTTINHDDHKNLKNFALCPFANENTHYCDVYSKRPIICRLFGTSYAYGYCEKIEKQMHSAILKRFSEKRAKKHMIGIQYNLELTRDIDWGTVPTGNLKVKNNIAIQGRPYPIIYWLSHDNMYLNQYHVAISQPKELYWSFLSGSAKV